MFSKNGQISIRQTYRLLLFDLVGMGTLLLPTMLAAACGGAGLWSIVIGAFAAYIYLTIIDLAIKKMKTDLLSYLEKYKIIIGFLGINAVMAAGFCAYIFTDLVRNRLVPQENFELILALILIVAAYAVSGGIESRARVYEVLFGVVIIPLFVMLLVAAKDVKPVYLTDIFNFERPFGIIKGSYFVFTSFCTLFYVLMFPAFVAPKNTKKLKSVGSVALLIAFVILLFAYLVLVGSFGSKALACMKYPTVTLMSTVKMESMFLKRTDAFMLGIWFFTLYAFLNINLFYGAKKMESILGRRSKRLYVAIVTIAVFIVANLFEYGDGMVDKYLKLLYTIGVPLLVLIPVVILFAGCNSAELEDRCFPMLAAVDMQGNDVLFSYVFPKTGTKGDDELENLYENNGGAGTDFSTAKNKCESNLVKKADANHLKVLLLGEDFYNERKLYEGMLKNMQEQEKFPRNAYVCITDDVNEITEAGNDLSEDVGTYLEQLLEKKQQQEGLVLVTIGDLIDENDNESITYRIPYVTVENEEIQINCIEYE